MIIGLFAVGALVGFVVVCVVIAARRGLWLMVEVDERVETTVTHHHLLHVEHTRTAIPDPAGDGDVVPGRVLARAGLPRTPRTGSHSQTCRELTR